MFEDRSIRRKRRFVLAVVFLLLASAAFGVGYFLNAGDPEALLDPKDPSKVNLQIPDSLINPKPVNEPVEQVNASSNTDINTETSENNVQEVSGQDEDNLTHNTQLIFKTHFTSCGHTIEKSVQASSEEADMDEKQLKEKFTDWEISAYSPPVIELSRRLDAYCPNHFIIGMEDGYIAIYVYDSNGNRTLQEKTDISVATLTPEDQQALEGGIIVDTDDQKEQTLEGFSD